MKKVAVIPARYSSSRFPGKPLVDICGKPMIQWVYERVSKVEEIDQVVVATDDERIYEVVQEFGGCVIMTGECSCGTERVYQTCKEIDADVVINVQGDEPLIKIEMIQGLIHAFEDETVQMVTLKKRITNEEEINNVNVVKVITDNQENAIYFSRYPIPYVRENQEIEIYKHIGIYGYRKTFLEKFISLPQGLLERAESLEQLRAIENGYKIKVVTTEFQSVGVDCPEDIEKVLEQIEKEGIR